MNKLLSIQRWYARVKSGRKAARPTKLLIDADFRFAADCERMRVDRNGSVLSLLLIELSSSAQTDAEVRFLARVLEGRLRITDTAGLLDDGRIGVLLPDTPANGAWKVAEDVSEVYPPGPERPQCDVLTYPNPGRRRSRWDCDGASVSAPCDDPDSSDFFFCCPLPRWKRALDVAGALTGLMVSLPIVAAAAAAIKATSRGPIIFSQEREGLGGRRFKMYKLRTMSVDAESRKSELRRHSVQDGPAFKLASDPRTTSIGRLLRWTSVDELPQFINVLKGDMSLVGPRPLPTEESRACQLWQRRRLSVTPGLTCSWQVTSRGTVKFDDWVRMDLRYARMPSLWTDLKLILLTVPALFTHRGVR